MYCDQQPHVPAARLPCYDNPQSMSQNKPFFPEFAYVSSFPAAIGKASALGFSYFCGQEITVPLTQ